MLSENLVIRGIIAWPQLQCVTAPELHCYHDGWQVTWLESGWIQVGIIGSWCPPLPPGSAGLYKANKKRRGHCNLWTGGGGGLAYHIISDRSSSWCHYIAGPEAAFLDWYGIILRTYIRVAASETSIRSCGWISVYLLRDCRVQI